MNNAMTKGVMESLQVVMWARGIEPEAICCKFNLERFERWATVIALMEFATQLLTDVMRGYGILFQWLIVCRVYFVLFGLALSLLFLFYARYMSSQFGHLNRLQRASVLTGYTSRGMVDHGHV